MKYLVCAALLSFSTMGIADGAFTDEEYIYEMPVGLVHAIDDLKNRGVNLSVHGCKIALMRCYSPAVTIGNWNFVHRELSKQTPKDEALIDVLGVKVGDIAYLKKSAYSSSDIPLRVFAMDDKAVFILKGREQYSQR